MNAIRKAAQAVLDRWDRPQWNWRLHGSTADLMNALRAAIAAQEAQPATVKDSLTAQQPAVAAKPGQEPLVWVVKPAKGDFVRACWTEKPTPDQIAFAHADGDTIIPAYAAPVAQPQAPMLTDQQISRSMLAVEDPLQWGRLGTENVNMLRAFARAIERAVRESLGAKV